MFERKTNYVALSSLSQDGMLSDISHVFKVIHSTVADCIVQHKPQVLSRDYVRASYRMSAAMDLRGNLEKASHRINFLLKHLDVAQYSMLKQLRAAVHRKYTFARAMDSVDPLLFEGRAIMWNRQTRLHGDYTDPVRAWVALVVLGAFKKGDLFIPRLNLRISYEPGTIVLIRGHILPHEVEAWVGGQRVSIVHFTHQSVWDEFGMECP
jgi:hypothetical protein